MEYLNLELKAGNDIYLRPDDDVKICTNNEGWGDPWVTFAGDERQVRIEGDISCSAITASGDLQVLGNNVDFNNLPSSSGGANTGGLYTQVGSELGLGGITGSIASKKFVLIK